MPDSLMPESLINYDAWEFDVQDNSLIQWYQCWFMLCLRDCYDWDLDVLEMLLCMRGFVLRGAMCMREIVVPKVPERKLCWCNDDSIERDTCLRYLLNVREFCLRYWFVGVRWSVNTNYKWLLDLWVSLFISQVYLKHGHPETSYYHSWFVWWLIVYG